MGRMDPRYPRLVCDSRCEGTLHITHAQKTVPISRENKRRRAALIKPRWSTLRRRLLPRKIVTLAAVVVVVHFILQFSLDRYQLCKRATIHFIKLPSHADESIGFRRIDRGMLRKLQLNSLRNQWWRYGDMRGHPVLSLLGPAELCVPICNDGWYERLRNREGPGNEQSCEGDVFFENYLNKEYTVSGNIFAPKLIVMVPVVVGEGDRKKYVAFIKSLSISATISSKSLSYVDFGVLMPSSLATWHVEWESTCCQVFDKLMMVHVDDTEIQRPQRYAMFMAGLKFARAQQKYDYMFWLQPNAEVVRQSWLDHLLLEAYDASPFLIKGPQRTIRNKRSMLQSMFEFIPTQHTMQLHDVAIYGLWHDGFVSAMQAVLADTMHQTLHDSSFACDLLNPGQVISTFMLHRACYAQYFLRYIRYSTFIMDGPLPNSLLKDNTYFVINGLASSSSNISFRRTKPKLSDCFSPNDLTYYGNMALGDYVHRVILNKTMLPMEQKSSRLCENLTYGVDVGSNGTRQVLQPTHTVQASPTRLLLVVPFATYQLPQVSYAVHRWAYFAPCSEKPSVFSATLMFMHSDLHGRQFSEDFLEVMTGNNHAVTECFSKAAYKFVGLPVDNKDAGTIAIFQEMMLGEVSDRHDFVFQMEPDVFPIRSNWLDKLINETNDASPFWVKGSNPWNVVPGYLKSCLTGAMLNQNSFAELTPLGPWLMHINGNALYALSPSFKELLLGLLDSARQTAFADQCLCKGQFSSWSLSCQRSVCTGVFDLALWEHIAQNFRRFESALPLYRYSDFVLNGFVPEHFGSCIPTNTYFVHKPLPHLSSASSSAYLQRLHSDLCSGGDEERKVFVRELQYYVKNGFPTLVTCHSHLPGLVQNTSLAWASVVSYFG